MKFVLLLFLILTSSTGYSQSEKRLYKQYQKAFDQQNFVKADKKLRKITDRENNNLLKILIIGNTYASVGELDSASRYLSMGIDFAKSQPMNYADDNFVRKKDSLYNLSIESYDIIIKEKPSAFEYQNRGVYKKDTGKPRAALKDFDSSIMLNKERGLTYYNRALAYRELNILDSAILDYKSCLEYNPTYYSANLNLGFIYMEQEEYDNAIDEFIILTEESSQIKGISYAKNNIGYCYFKLGQYRRADKYISESIKMNSINSYAFKNKALVKIATNKLEEACQAIQQAIDLGFVNKYGNEILELQSANCKD